MSYDIQLYRIETRDRQQQSGNGNFFDNEENLVPFTDEQFNELKERLIDYDYEIVKETKDQIDYRHAEYSINALLTKRGVYFTAGFNQEDIFEAGMAASEFTDTGEFAKYDPQSNGWEEI